MLIGNGANLLILQSGGQAGSPPILERESEAADAMSDPLAQAMILTAIVISMAMTAFMLALAYRQYRYRTDDVVERAVPALRAADHPRLLHEPLEPLLPEMPADAAGAGRRVTTGPRHPVITASSATLRPPRRRRSRWPR